MGSLFTVIEGICHGLFSFHCFALLGNDKYFIEIKARQRAVVQIHTVKSNKIYFLQTKDDPINTHLTLIIKM